MVCESDIFTLHLFSPAPHTASDDALLAELEGGLTGVALELVLGVALDTVS